MPKFFPFNPQTFPRAEQMEQKVGILRTGWLFQHFVPGKAGFLCQSFTLGGAFHDPNFEVKPHFLSGLGRFPRGGDPTLCPGGSVGSIPSYPDPSRSAQPALPR